MSHGVVGCFLVRNTKVSPGDKDNYCLSILAPENGPRFRHLLVVKNEQNYYKINSLPADSEMFPSLSDMIEFYCENEIHFHDSGPSVTLTEPCRGRKVLSVIGVR